MTGAPQDVATAQAQAAALRRNREAPPAAPADQRDAPAAGAYAGLVTRVIAFALDAAVVNGCALVVGVTVGLGLSILHLPSETDSVIAVILAALAVVWVIAYFTFFWSTTGQTPGDRVMRIEVIDRDGLRLRPLRAALRFGCVILAAIPLLAGILMMLWDDRRRCLQDRLTHTLVVYAPTLAQPAGALSSQVDAAPTPTLGAKARRDR